MAIICEFDRMLINLSKPCEPKIQAQYPMLSTIYLSFTTFALKVYGYTSQNLGNYIVNNMF